MPKLRHADDQMLLRDSVIRRVASLLNGRQPAVAGMMTRLIGDPVGFLKWLIATPAFTRRGRLATCPVRARSHRRLR